MSYFARPGRRRAVSASYMVDLGPGSQRLNYLIQTTALSKSFGSKLAVDSLDLVVPEGSIYGFLGPNGSGKTTTIRMLLGLVFPSGGEIKVLGRSVPKESASVLCDIGAVVEGPGLYPALSGRRYLERMAHASKSSRRRAIAGGQLGPSASVVPDIAAALELVGLTKVADRRVKAFSLGMKQRLALANALLFERKLLILDEPTNGMDPQGIVEMRELVLKLSAAGTTVFISSHILSEIEQLCSHVGVIQHGKLAFQGEIGELRDQLPAKLVIGADDPARARSVLSTLYSLEATDGESGTLVLARGDVPIAKITASLVEAGIGVYRVAEDRSTLEEAFVALTGEVSDVS